MSSSENCKTNRVSPFGDSSAMNQFGNRKFHGPQTSQKSPYPNQPK